MVAVLKPQGSEELILTRQVPGQAELLPAEIGRASCRERV